jgi:hypothetical protein
MNIIFFGILTFYSGLAATALYIGIKEIKNENLKIIKQKDQRNEKYKR